MLCRVALGWVRVADGDIWAVVMFLVLGTKLKPLYRLAARTVTCTTGEEITMAPASLARLADKTVLVTCECITYPTLWLSYNRSTGLLITA
jgi:hypothetical protein